MIVKYDVEHSRGQVSVEGMDELKFFPYKEGVVIYNISDGENCMSLDLTFRELRILDAFIQEMKKDSIVKKRME